MKSLRLLLLLSAALWVSAAAQVPVEVKPVSAPHGMVVAGHPQAAQIGVDVLKSGGNAVDAAIAVSLALGVAEPYASGLGGKLMLLYYEASTGRTYALDAMDAAGASLDVAAARHRTEAEHNYGYASVAVPGLPAGLWLAHERWGSRPWADLVAPAAALARAGGEILPKTRELFAEQEAKLRRGDAEIARIFLPGGALPAVGSRLPNPDLARTLDLLAAHGRDGFYRGPIAEALAAAETKAGGGTFNLADLAAYEARLSEPIGIDFQGYQILSSPPPTNGAPLTLTILKVLEADTWQGPLRSPANLDRIGRVWRLVQPRVQAVIADVPEAAFNFEKLVAPDAIAEFRAKSAAPAAPGEKAAWLADPSGWSESYAAATTHFIVVDARGNIVCATQSLSYHFGAGVVVPGTGIVLNNSMSNFAYNGTRSVNLVAPGKRPRSTIAPTLVLRQGHPVFAVGIPGSGRIPTALLQVVLDRLAFHRPLADAIGDTRVHFNRDWRDDKETFEAEQSLPAAAADALRRSGWQVELTEPAGTGKRFGGINAIEINPDGTLAGFADPRRTNAAAGY